MVRSGIQFIPEAAKDYKELDGSLKKLVNKKIEKNPILGEKLGNKFNIDLTGFLKTYIASKKNRIVYRVLSPKKVEIVVIWGIGKRAKEEIYRTLAKRLGPFPL